MFCGKNLDSGKFLPILFLTFSKKAGTSVVSETLYEFVLSIALYCPVLNTMYSVSLGINLRNDIAQLAVYFISCR